MPAMVSDDQQKKVGTMPAQPAPQPAAGAWSQPIRGLAGRLRVEFEALDPGLRHAVYLELQNYFFDPVAVTNQPEIRAELLDSSGSPVGTSALSMSGPIPEPQWGVIPRDAYIGFRVDMQTVGVPMREHGVALLALGGKSWELKVGEYVLTTTLVCQEREDAPPNQWVGDLELPPVEVVVTLEKV
jgi:hypothetical protein